MRKEQQGQIELQYIQGDDGNVAEDTIVGGDDGAGTGAEVGGENVGGQGARLLRNDEPVGTTTTSRGLSCCVPNFSRWGQRSFCILFGTALASTILTVVFAGLYINERISPRGGEVIPTPVILKISSKSDYPDNPNYERMFISGYNDTHPEGQEPPPGIVRWRNQGGFWYLEVLPLTETFKDCPIRNSLFGRLDPVLELNPPEKSSCNLYDFRLVIFNALDTGATIHFHGLTPPSNQDGVPFVANANINAQNLQRYRFNQFTYPGMHWMHAHTGFQQAFGVSAPIILQHSDRYDDANDFSTDDDFVVMLEDGKKYPKCGYSNIWFEKECKEKTDVTTASDVSLLINRGEDPLELIPGKRAKNVRMRFLNAGSLANWRITTSFSVENNGTDADMEIIAIDGQDVVRGDNGVKTKSFVLGLANRVDVLVGIDSDDKDILITAAQMAPFGDVTNPALRYVVIRGRETLPGQEIKIDALSKIGQKTETVQTNFGIIANLTAAHPLPPKSSVDTEFTIWNGYGNFDGGYVLTIYEGLVNPLITDVEPLHKFDNYTQLNNLKFQLPPYKVYKSKTNPDMFISTTRECESCVENADKGGIRMRPSGSMYEVFFKDVPKDSGDTCCWEWCDVPEDACGDFELVDVNDYQPNKNFIPVCFGDRVRLRFINTAEPEGHPIHLHGHDFAITQLFDVDENNKELSPNSDHTFKISGPKLDTIYIPYNQSVDMDFDAFNPGEHLIHCHIDDHLVSGMLTTVRYMHDGDCQDLPEFVGGENPFPKQFCGSTGCTPSETKRPSKEL